MSCCKLITFRDGKPCDAVEFSNAWGGAAFIWDALFNAYLKDASNEFDSWISRGTDDRGLWDLAKRANLPMFERVVLAATFDRAMVTRSHFKRFASDLREFADKYPANGKACHLRAWAAFVEACEEEAIGFYGTSVSENLWFGYDEEDTDETIPYDMHTRDEHFEVYLWLQQVDSEATAAAAETRAKRGRNDE